MTKESGFSHAMTCATNTSSTTGSVEATESESGRQKARDAARSALVKLSSPKLDVERRWWNEMFGWTTWR